MEENNQIISINTADIEAKEWVATRDTLVTSAKFVTKVTNNEELEQAGKVEADIKKHVKALATIRLNITRPLDEAKKSVCAKEKELVKVLESEQARVNILTTAYANELVRRAEQERLAVEAAERAAAEAAVAVEEAAAEAARQAAQANAAFGLDAAAPAPAPAPVATVIPVPVVTTTGPHTESNRFVEKWDFEITDQNAVPRELCSPDPAKIRALMAAKKAEGYKAAQIVVSGVKITSTVQVYSR